MNDQEKEPSGDILRGLAKEHEDQPGDLAKTKTGQRPEPAPKTDERKPSS